MTVAGCRVGGQRFEFLRKILIDALIAAAWFTGVCKGM
jgi:hypothetical protein